LHQIGSEIPVMFGVNSA